MFAVLAEAAGNAAQPIVVFPHKAPLEQLWQSLVAVSAFGILGIFMTILGFKLFDWLMPHIKVEKELCERNYAVAIVMAAGIIGVSAVIVAAIIG